MKIKRVLSLFLVFTILFTLLPQKDIPAEAANYTVTISHVGQGTADFGGGTTSATLGSGTQTQFQTIPANYYRVSRITINGIEQVVQNDGGSHVYPFTVDGNKTIVVYFSTSTGHTPSVVFDTADAVNMLKHANTNSYSKHTNVSFGTVYDYNNSAEHCAILSPSTSTTDPYIYMCYDAYGAIPTNSYNYVIITAKIPKTNSKTYENGFLWPITTGASPADYNVNTGFGYGFKWINDGQWHDYVFKLQGVSGWSGSLKALRLDYFDSFSGNAPTSDKFYLRSIKFITGSVSKPTVSVNTSAFNTGSLSFTASYSGLDNYMTDNFNQTQLPFIGIYADGVSPGTGSALQWQFVTGNSGSVSFPISAGATDKSGGTTMGQLPPGNYKVWLAYDAAGTLPNKGANLNNAYYATQYWDGSATPVSLGTTSRSIRIDPKVTISNGTGGTATFTSSNGSTYTSGSFFTQYNKSITVSANPSSGYRVKSIKVGSSTWTNTDKTHDKTISKTYTITANTTITVEYVKMYAVTFSQPTGGTIAVVNTSNSNATVSSGGYVDTGSVIKVTATAKTGYTFSSLKAGSTSLSSGGTYTVSAATTITASFTVNQYTLTYTASPTGGTVTVKNGSTTIASGTKVNYGTSLTVTATASTGYTLSALKYGSTSISSGDSFTMPAANTTVSATFTKNSYKMTITNPTGATITVKDASNNSYSSGASIPYNTKLTVTLTPSSGYRVKTVTIDGTTKQTYTTMSTTAVTYTYTVGAAAFTISGTAGKIFKVSYSQVTGGTIAVTNNSGGATISNGAYVDTGTVIKVTVTEATGYNLSTLKAGSTSISNGGTYKVEAATTVAATYVKEKYKVTISASNGTVTVKNGSTTIASGTEVEYGTVLTVTATPATGYKLSSLKAGSTTLSSGGTFTLTAATTVTGTFAKQSYKMTITNPTGATITVKDASGNAVSSGASVTYQSVLTVTLTPSSGYRVKTVTINGTSKNTYTTMSTTAVTYEYTVGAADFTVSGTAGKIFKVSYSQVTGGTIAVTNNSGGATISSGSYVDTGTTIKVTVTESTGYDLSTLKAGSTSLSNGGTYKVEAATTVAATYVKEKYTVTISASNGTVTLKDASGNAISSGSSVEYGTVITVTATPATGYKLSSLKAGSTTLSSGGTFTLTAATTVTGTFAKQSYKMTITNPTGATITVKDASGNAVSSGASVTYQSVLTVTLTPSSGYRVKTVTINGTSKNTYTTMSTTAVTYEYTVGAADFTVSGTAGKIYKVTITNPTGGTVTVKNGSTSVSSGSYVDTGTSLTITLTPDAGYRVKTITAAGTSIKDNSTISNAAVSATHSITAATTYSGTCGKIYKVTISNPSNGTVTVKNGSTSVSSGSYVDTGTSLTITLTPGAGYRVKTITAAGSSIKSNSTVSNAAVSATDAIDADTTYSGTVGAIYKVTISNPSGGKVTVKNGSTSVSSGGYVDTGTSLTITLTPNSGYRVKTITAAGSSIKSNSTISNAAVSVSHTITADTTYSGTCGQIFNVSVGVISNNGSVTLSKTGLADVNSTITITATPEPGYALNTLYVNGVAISGNTFKVTGAAVVTAKFISIFEVEVFAQTVGSAISSTSIKNTAGAVSNKFTQGTVSIATTEYNNILGKYGSTVTVSVTGITSGIRFLGWYDKNGNTYDRLLSADESYVLSAGLHTNMQIVAVFTATTETDTVFNFRNVYGQAVQTLVASKGSYVPVTEITATPFKSGSVFTGWEFLKNAYKSTAVKKTLDPDGDGTTSTYYLIDGTTQPTYKYDYSILYKESSCATPLFIYVNGAGGEVNIDGAYTKIASNKVVITVTGEGKVNNASSASVAYNTTVTATATGTGTFIGWIDKTNGTTRYSAEAFTTDNVTYYPYISYEKTFSFKALNAMTIQPVYGTSAGNKPNVSMNSVIQLQNNTAEKNNKYTAYGIFTATPGDGYEIVEWGTLFFVASDASTLPTTVITNASTGATETVNMLTLETVGPMQISRNIYEDNSNPSGQYAAGIKVASARTIYVRMYCTYSYTDASTGELKYAVTYSDTYVFSTAAYSSSTASGFVSNVTRYEEPSSSLDNSGAIELF